MMLRTQNSRTGDNFIHGKTSNALFQTKKKLIVKINKGQKFPNFLLFFAGHLNKGICLIHFTVIPPLMETSHEFPDFPLYQIYTFNQFLLYFFSVLKQRFFFPESE